MKLHYLKTVSIFYIEFWHIISLIISVSLNLLIYVKSKKDKLLFFFLYLQSTFILWMIAKILKTVSPNVDLRWFFIVLQYFGVCLVEVAFLEFAYVYAYGKSFTKKLRIIIYVIPLFQFAVVATNPFHMLFYSKYNFDSDSFGPLFYAHMFITYSMYLFSMFLCSKKLKENFRNVSKIQVYIVTTAILFPFIFNFIYVTRTLSGFFKSIGIRIVFDITPIAFTVSLFLFVYAIFKYEFLDVLPIIKDHIINSIDTGIILVDQNGKIISINNSISHKIKHKITNNNLKFDAIFKEIFQEEFDENIPSRFLSLKSSEKTDFFEVKTKPLYSKNNKKYGIIVSFHNITEIINLQGMLEDQNLDITKSNMKLQQQIEVSKEATKIRTHNFVARELHDILGHSMTLVINLLETSKLYSKSNKEVAENGVSESLEVLKTGYRDLRHSISSHDIEERKTASMLENEISSIIHIVTNAGLKTKFIFKSEKEYILEKEYFAIKRLCQEGLTNALKHGKSSDAIVSVKLLLNKTTINIVDNGSGCKNIVKGNGLKGMEERVTSLGGSLSFNSDGENGFIIYAEF